MAFTTGKRTPDVTSLPSRASAMIARTPCASEKWPHASAALGSQTSRVYRRCCCMGDVLCPHQPLHLLVEHTTRDQAAGGDKRSAWDPV